MARKLLIAPCLLFCSAFIINTTAQEIPHFIEKLSTEEGLSSNKINDLAQDDIGFLWVATSDGLNRFDGTQVTQYYHQDSANSLSHNYVYCLKKLPGNYLAIGTQAGLSFYNGNTGMFRNFYQAQNNALDEYNNTIIGLEVDIKGNLWAASRNCVYIFNADRVLKKIFTSPFTEEDATRKRLRYVEKIIPLSDGHVLLCLYDGWYIGSVEANGLTRLKQSPYKHQLGFIEQVSTSAATTENGQYFPSSHIFRIFDRYLLCIQSDKDSLLVMDEKGHQWSACFFPYNKYPYVSWSQQVAMIDSTHLLFLFHNYGLGIITVTWQHGRPSIRHLSPLLFETNEYANALCDRQGNWWLATTEDGLQKISPHKQSFKGSTLVNSSSDKRITYEVVYTTRFNNTIWIATYGDGFFKIDLPSGQQHQYRFNHTEDDTWANFIWTVRQVSADTLWVGTQAGLFWYAIPKRRHGRIAAYPGKPPALDSVPVTTQFVDSRGLVWMGLGKGRGVCYFDPKDRRFTYFPGNSQAYPLRYPLVISEDKKGNLWCTNDASNLLTCWNRNARQFKIIPLPPMAKKQVSNLYGIYCESDSVIWLGSVTSGLIKFNIAKNSITLYGHDKGLINSHISNIYEDRAKRLWLATEGGLSCFDPRKGSFFNYSGNEGLPVKYPTAFFYYDSLDKRLYSGGRGAFFYFDPESMHANRPPQKTVITAMQVNDHPYAPEHGKPASFTAQQNHITIHYTAIDLTAGPQTKYMYKLIGEDTGWIMAGHQRQINFSHLAPGHYTFMVRSQNSQGVWSHQGASISFHIHPPFTQTAWFYGLIILAIGGLFYGLYRFSLQQIKRTEQIRNEISKNLHDEVGSTLTNISLGSLLAQKQLQQEGPVSKLLERIYQDSQTVSQTMREIVWSINPNIDTLGEALPRMLQYASELLEAKNIELKAEIPPEIEHIKLTMQRRRDLYLIFKEAVNNLARHSKASHVHICFSLANAMLVMTIADDGTGFNKLAPFMGSGLKNMKERAKSHRWQLVIQSDPGAGTILTLKAIIA